MDEAALDDVDNHSSLLFCGPPQEPEEARCGVRCDLTTTTSGDSFCTSDNKYVSIFHRHVLYLCSKRYYVSHRKWSTLGRTSDEYSSSIVHCHGCYGDKAGSYGIFEITARRNHRSGSVLEGTSATPSVGCFSTIVARAQEQLEFIKITRERNVLVSLYFQPFLDAFIAVIFMGNTEQSIL